MHAKQELTFKKVMDTSWDVIEALVGAISNDGDTVKNKAKEDLNGYFKYAKKNYFGFFSPYPSLTGPAGLGIHLAAPIVTPIALCLVAGISLIGATVGTVALLGHLFFTGCAGVVSLFNKNAKEDAMKSFGWALFAGLCVALCTTIIAVVAVVAAVLTPLFIASIFTRSGATAYSAASDCFARSKVTENIEIINQACNSSAPTL